jgi:hypothetical protein
MRTLKKSISGLLLLASTCLPTAAHACACCLNGTGQYSVTRGVDAYQAGELLARTTTLRTQMDFGIEESNTVFTNPQLLMQQVSAAQGGAWNITLTERDGATKQTHSVVLRFKPAPIAKWTYIRHTKPLDKQRDTGGLSHDFLIPGTMTVLRDKAGVMKAIHTNHAQLTLYGESNNCFDRSSLHAFMLEVGFLGKDSASSMSGEGRIP